jgi:ubiquinone/menaquinone biosynthesis C-methylase UbiE
MSFAAREHYREVNDYFNEKAEVYDDVDEQLYWVLSDIFFKEVLKREIPALFADKQEVRLLDAGAGTGRWTLFFYELFRQWFVISGDLIDINAQMLEQARKKISKAGLDERFLCWEGDIEEMLEMKNGYYDIALSFYNVISFVDNPQKALASIAEKLKEEGVHISIVANKYHAYYFSLLTNQLDELDMIRAHSKVRFNKQMPYIHCFSPEELRELYLRSGYRKVKVIGGPNFFYPGMEETLTSGSTGRIDQVLSNEAVFRKILEIELECYDRQDLTGRGNVLMAIARK